MPGFSISDIRFNKSGSIYKSLFEINFRNFIFFKRTNGNSERNALSSAKGYSDF